MQLFLLLMSCFVIEKMGAAEQISFSSVICPGEIGIIQDYKTMYMYRLKTHVAILIAFRNDAGESVVGLSNNASEESVNKMLQSLGSCMDKSQWKNVQCAIIAPGSMKRLERHNKWVNEFDHKVSRCIGKLQWVLRNNISQDVASYCNLYPYIPSKKDLVISYNGRFGHFTMPDIKVKKTKENTIEWNYCGDGYRKHVLLEK